MREGAFNESSLVWNIGVVFDELLNEGLYFRTEGEVLDTKCTLDCYRRRLQVCEQHHPRSEKAADQSNVEGPGPAHRLVQLNPKHQLGDPTHESLLTKNIYSWNNLIVHILGDDAFAVILIT